MSFSEWSKYKFSDFVYINLTISLKGGGEFSFIEMKDLSEGKRSVEPSAEKKITGGARFREGNTLFARITPCLQNGKIGQAIKLKNALGFGSTEFLVFEEKPKVSDKDFIYYLACWQEVRKFAEQNMVGTSGRQRVGKDAFEKLELTLPPLKTQQRIASILSSLDDKIELNRQTNQTLEAMAQTLFKEMCLPKADVLEDGWRVAKLREVCDLIKGVSYRSTELTASRFALVTLKSMTRGGGFNFKGFKEFDGKYKESQIVEEGDVVIAQTDITQNADIIGCPAIVENPFNYDKLIVSIDLVKCQSKDGELVNEVLFYFLQNQTFKDFCLSHTNGSTVLHLRSSELSNYEFVIPNKIVLANFEKQIIPIRKQIISLNKETQSLTILRDSLLPKLMKGEITILTEDYVAKN